MLNPEQISRLHSLPMAKAIEYWGLVEKDAIERGDANAAVRMLCQCDLFYLMVRVCGRKDLLNDFAFARCREVEKSPYGYVDLWAREHFKSSILTFGHSIQSILKDPNITIGLFSHTRPIAKAFLRQIMRELQENETLHAAFPDILWGKDIRQAPKWALAIDTPILTTKGWKSHGDLEIGDRIYGSSGQEITVIGNSGPMNNAKCRRVVFDDSELIASSEHLWPVQHMYGHTWKESEIRTLQTDELRVGKRTDRMLPTPIIQSQEKQLTLDPYILGLWLGDGTAVANIISMHRDDESECLAQFYRAKFDFYIHRRKEYDNFSMYGLTGLKQVIEKIGCLRKKFIPEDYLFASKDQRLSLLQGLMDSDGTIKKDAKNRCAGMCMFSNTNPDIADGVFHLASSLGLRPSIFNSMPKSVGKKRVYHVYFVGLKSIPPFRLKRKIDLCKDKKHKVGRYLRDIEVIPSVTVNCIKVDAPDSLYLAGRSMIPTHNSEDDGFIVKRSQNPNEATMEAWGLVDGQPTSKHYKVLHYDDIVVQGSVTTPEMIQKTMTALEQSYNLGVTPGGKRKFIGTRWHFNDAYKTIKDRGTAIPREHPGKVGGVEEGKSVFWPEEVHLQKRQDMGPYTYAAQILLNPKADAMQGFKRDWIKKFKSIKQEKLNWYILCDAASSKKKGSDYTSMWAVGLGVDGNYYCIPEVRDRLNLKERGDRLFELHRKYKPKQVRYEKYGLMSDIEHYQDRMENENYRFTITEVAGQTSKNDRVKRLLPLFESERIWIPENKFVTDWQKIPVDLVHAFIEEEYMAFPVGLHDDMLDSLARICEPDLKLVWPKEEKPVILQTIRKDLNKTVAWMG